MWLFLPFFWGLMEATVFFMVPDVPISFITMKRGAKAGIIASFVAACGAAIGGIAMFYWARQDLFGVLTIIEKLPAISEKMIIDVKTQMQGSHPFIAMLLGAFRGTPYKIYASFAPYCGIPIWKIFLLTPLIRLPRFLMVVFATKYANSFAKRMAMKQSDLIKFAVVTWILFYLIYWLVMPS